MHTNLSAVRRALCWVLLLALPVLAACTDSYMPEAVTSPPKYLVIDGFINPQGVTTIRLSRTIGVASATAPPPETRATVYVEEENGPRYPLPESSISGTYASASLTLNTNKRYRLRLTTNTSKQYASDFVPVKITPAIDAVNWRVENPNLNIYLNTHDATGQTQYYRWEYTETWEIHPVYQPEVEYVNGAIRNLAVPYPKLCWGNLGSTIVQIDKTTALSQDIVANYRLRQLPANSERFFALYSILVQQHALTKEEYAYWELLRKNTENIGTLFDPQPAQLTGNVYCLTTPSELAIGFVGAHSLAEKRIFISRTALNSAAILTGYESCPADTILLNPPPPPRSPPPPAVILQNAFGNPKILIPINRLFDNSGQVLKGYTAQSPGCVDCRTRGTSVKPSFWP